ncbi:VIT1/CCC1 transporter family protein [Psychromicrobium xiongbiense]|uniref:VIT1/CCC1 transporter family protein n=1 Tax=Psychromicrobium xiongbiense TaxID=3051184 RepID=UPI0025536C86|nr:VIT1/CCC1 family protein [Psychromicrobium sp. YIM S02556]
MPSATPSDPSSTPSGAQPDSAPPSAAQIKRWQGYLADERAEAAVYRALAERRSGEEREILLALAEAEGRHEHHWLALLGPHASTTRKASLNNRLLGFFARNFGSVFVLALAQRAESRSPYATDSDATETMAADEAIHEEVIRALATRGRNRLSGTFRAAVFGANDGLVSNLSLLMGMAGAGAGSHTMLLAGIAGLLAGALSMGAGEYVSVRSQRELLTATLPTQITLSAAKALDLNANELVLVYRARGMSLADAEHRAAERLGLYDCDCDCDPSLSFNPTSPADGEADAHETVGTAFGAAASSFCFFASGAVIPVLPFIIGLSGWLAVGIAIALVGLALVGTGAIVGLLSGTPPLARGVRQLVIGLGAAAVTYLLGLAFGTVTG